LPWNDHLFLDQLAFGGERFDVGEMDFNAFAVGADMTGPVLHLFCVEGYPFGIQLFSRGLFQLGIEITGI